MSGSSPGSVCSDHLDHGQVNPVPVHSSRRCAEGVGAAAAGSRPRFSAYQLGMTGSRHGPSVTCRVGPGRLCTHHAERFKSATCPVTPSTQRAQPLLWLRLSISLQRSLHYQATARSLIFSETRRGHAHLRKSNYWTEETSHKAVAGRGSNARWGIGASVKSCESSICLQAHRDHAQQCAVVF